MGKCESCINLVGSIEKGLCQKGVGCVMYSLYSPRKEVEDKIKPSYYHKGKVDTIEFCIENKLGFCEGNIVKYIVRYADKNGMEDLLKVKEYLDRIIKNEEEKQCN